jgi:hypothetical protein
MMKTGTEIGVGGFLLVHLSSLSVADIIRSYGAVLEDDGGSSDRKSFCHFMGERGGVSI